MESWFAGSPNAPGRRRPWESRVGTGEGFEVGGHSQKGHNPPALTHKARRPGCLFVRSVLISLHMWEEVPQELSWKTLTTQCRNLSA